MDVLDGHQPPTGGDIDAYGSEESDFGGTHSSNSNNNNNDNNNNAAWEGGGGAGNASSGRGSSRGGGGGDTNDHEYEHGKVDLQPLEVKGQGRDGGLRDSYGGESFGAKNSKPGKTHVYRGYIQKQRNWISGWVDYYFVLTDRSLHYFKKKPVHGAGGEGMGNDHFGHGSGDDMLLLGDRKGSIDLLDVVLELSDSDPRGFELIAVKSGKVRVMRCPHADDTTQWAVHIVTTQVALCHSMNIGVPALRAEPSPLYARIIARRKKMQLTHRERGERERDLYSGAHSPAPSGKSFTFPKTHQAMDLASLKGTPTHSRRPSSSSSLHSQYMSLNNSFSSSSSSKLHSSYASKRGQSSRMRGQSPASRSTHRKLDFDFSTGYDSDHERSRNDPKSDNNTQHNDSKHSSNSNSVVPAMVAYVQQSENQKQRPLRIGTPFRVLQLREGEEVMIGMGPSMHPVSLPFTHFNRTGAGHHTYLSPPIDHRHAKKGSGLKVTVRWSRLTKSPRLPPVELCSVAYNAKWTMGYMVDIVLPIIALMCCLWMILVGLFEDFSCTRDTALPLRFVNLLISVPHHLLLPALSSLGLESIGLNAHSLTVAIFSAFSAICVVRLLYLSCLNEGGHRGVLPEAPKTRGLDLSVTVVKVERASIDLLSSYLGAINAFKVDGVHEFPCGKWTQSDIVGIKVRGPSYNRGTGDRVKIPAQKHIFTLLHFQISKTPTKLSHIARAPSGFFARRRKLQRAILKHKLKVNPKLERAMRASKAERDDVMTESFPLMFIVNFQIPGYSTVCYFEMNKDELHRVKKHKSSRRRYGSNSQPPPYSGDKTRARGKGNISFHMPSISEDEDESSDALFDRKRSSSGAKARKTRPKEGFDVLLQRFLDGTDAMRNARFKLIPRVVEGNYLVKKVVGTTPAIIGNKLYQRCYRNTDPYANYIEVDVDVTSSVVGTRILKLCKGYATSLIIDLMFLLEGQMPDELPERLIGGVRIMRADLSKCDDFPESTVRACSNPDG